MKLSKTRLYEDIKGKNFTYGECYFLGSGEKFDYYMSEDFIRTLVLYNGHTVFYEIDGVKGFEKEFALAYDKYKKLSMLK
jgi:hypothetical protein